ncbi:MAG: hypothetical protein WAZ34_06465 [Rhodocyclaceae bacterium]
MFFLCKRFCPVALAAVLWCLPSAYAADLSFFPPIDSFGSAAPAQVDAQTAFEALAALPTGERESAKSRLVALEVDLGNSPGFSSGTVDGRLEARYRMAFNNVAEGWNWYPQADPQHEDYYRAKFLPLKSVTVERGEYDHQDKIGETQRMKVTWRYDYFLSFENLYDFYPRGIDDDAGFVASLPVAGPGEQGEAKVRMLALASLGEPYVSESTTFWKATYGKPTDFTLKKRYLIGRLEAVWFVDADSGRVLARLQRKTAP